MATGRDREGCKNFAPRKWDYDVCFFSLTQPNPLNFLLCLHYKYLNLKYRWKHSKAYKNTSSCLSKK